MDSQESLEKFLRGLEKMQNQADGKEPERVQAKAFKQLGQEVLVATCPGCGTVAGLDREGKHCCRGCGKWLHYVR